MLMILCAASLPAAFAQDEKSPNAASQAAGGPGKVPQAGGDASEDYKVTTSGLIRHFNTIALSRDMISS